MVSDFFCGITVGIVLGCLIIIFNADNIIVLSRDTFSCTNSRMEGEPYERKEVCTQYNKKDK